MCWPQLKPTLQRKEALERDGGQLSPQTSPQLGGNRKSVVGRAACSSVKQNTRKDDDAGCDAACVLLCNARMRMRMAITQVVLEPGEASAPKGTWCCCSNVPLQTDSDQSAFQVCIVSGDRFPNPCTTEHPLRELDPPGVPQSVQECPGIIVASGVGTRDAGLEEEHPRGWPSTTARGNTHPLSVSHSFARCRRSMDRRLVWRAPRFARRGTRG